MAGFSREVARRIFTEELKSSNYSFRDGEDQHQYAPQYLLTPTGAKCNRVFMVGILTEKDDIGGDTEYWRGRVVDPTGSILIYAGQYQPEAAQILANMEAPAYVAVVGKPNLYQTEDGNIIISLRAEAIQRVDEETRNQWIIDTARRTLERLQVLSSASPVPISGDFATADKVPAATTPAQDAQRAREHYQTDIDHYRQMVIRALTSLEEDLAEGRSKAKDVPLAPTAKPESGIDESRIESGAGIGEPPAAEKTMLAAKRPRTKKSESLNAWPEQESDEEVETFHIGKKS
jgi:RPA family protein